MKYVLALMTKSPPPAVGHLGESDSLYVAGLIGLVSMCTATLFIYKPSVIFAGLVIGLILAAFLRFDLIVYYFIFSLPWYPQLDLPVRDIYLLLRFVLFFGVWMRIKRQDKSVYHWLIGTRQKKGVVLFTGIAAASFLFSGLPADIHAYRSLALLVSYLMVFFAIEGWLERPEQLVRVLKLLLISTIGVALFGFYQAIEGGYTDLYFRLYPFEEDVIAPWAGRITSVLFQENSLAGYLNLVIPIAIACAIVAKQRGLKYLGVVCALSSIAAMFLTQSRGGLLALVGILLISVWLLVPRLIDRVKILGAIALACVLFLPPLLYQFERLQGIDDATQQGRTFVWLAAAKMFLDHPLLGVGYGNYRFLYVDFVPNAVLGKIDSHNLYLQILAETGLVGFLSFSVLLGSFISLGLKSIRAKDPLSQIVAFGVIGAIASTLIHGMVDFLFGGSPQFGALYWIVLGLGSWALTHKGRELISAVSTA